MTHRRLGGPPLKPHLCPRPQARRLATPSSAWRAEFPRHVKPALRPPRGVRAEERGLPQGKRWGRGGVRVTDFLPARRPLRRRGGGGFHFRDGVPAHSGPFPPPEVGAAPCLGSGPAPLPHQPIPNSPGPRRGCRQLLGRPAAPPHLPSKHWATFHPFGSGLQSSCPLPLRSSLSPCWDPRLLTTMLPVSRWLEAGRDTVWMVVFTPCEALSGVSEQGKEPQM